MRFVSLCIVVFSCAVATPAFAVRVGQTLPEPPPRTTDGGSIDVHRWLSHDLVVWYLFDVEDAEAARALTWLAPPRNGRSGYRAVGVPVGNGASVTTVAAAVPLLADGARWRPQLGLDARPPLLVLTRPPGEVVAVYRTDDAMPQRIPLLAVSLHIQREDWAAVLEVVGRAGAPLVDPTLHAARAYAGLGMGELTLTQDEAQGLAQVGPNHVFKAAGHAILAAAALRAGDLTRADAAARKATAVAEGLGMQAQVALARGDLAVAMTAADAAREADAVLPWTGGAHALVAAHVATLQGRHVAAAQYAADATRRAPASWRAWQGLGLAKLRLGDTEAGVDLLRIAAALAPRESAADDVADAAKRAVAGEPSPKAARLVVLEAGSVPHLTWPGAGPTAALRFAEAVGQAGAVRAAAYSMTAEALQEGRTFGEPVDAAAALEAARASGAEHLVLLRMQAAERGIVLNARVLAVPSGGLRALDSMVWTPDLTLDAACTELAQRVQRRLR